MKNKKTLILMAILFVSMLLMPLNNIFINIRNENINNEIVDDDSQIDNKFDSFDLFETLDLSEVSLDPWWNGSFLYRKLINITNPNSVDLVNHTVSIEINYSELVNANKMNESLKDVRIVENDILREYYIKQDFPVADNATIWFKVNCSASTTDYDTFMYYGNNDTNYASTLLSENPAGLIWFKFEEGSGFNAIDSLGKYNATLVNSPGYVSGKIGSYSLDLDGTSDYLYINDLFYNTNGQIDKLTVSCWFKTTYTGSSYSSNWAFFDYDRSEYFNFYVRGDNGAIGFSTRPSTGSIDDFYSTTTGLNNDQWHFAAIVYDGSDKYIYIDPDSGTEDIKGFGNNPHAGLNLGSGTTRYGFIGDGSEASTENGNRNGILYDGQIDEVRYFEDTLSSSEIYNLYKNYQLTVNINEEQKQQAEVKFTTLDVDGRIVPNGEVSLYNGSTGVWLSTKNSSTDGTVIFTNLDYGEYNVTVNYTINSGLEELVFNSSDSSYGSYNFTLTGLYHTFNLPLNMSSFDFQIVDWDGYPINYGYVNISESLTSAVLETLTLDSNGKATFRWLNRTLYYYKTYYKNDDYNPSTTALNESYINRSWYIQNEKIYSQTIWVNQTDIGGAGTFEVKEYFYSNGSRTTLSNKKILKANISLSNMDDHLTSVKIFYVDKNGDTYSGVTNDHLLYENTSFTGIDKSDFIQIDVINPPNIPSQLVADNYEVYGLYIDFQGQNSTQCNGTVKVDTIETCNVYNQTALAKIHIRVIDNIQKSAVPSVIVHVINGTIEDGKSIVNLTTAEDGFAYGHQNNDIGFWYLGGHPYNFTLEFFGLKKNFNVTETSPPQWMPSDPTDHYNYTLQQNSSILFNLIINQDDYVTSFIESSGDNIATWGQSISYTVNFSYSTDGGGSWDPITLPEDITATIKDFDGVSVSSKPMTELGNGYFTVDFNSNILSAGDSLMTYTVEITGSKTGYSDPIPETFLLQVNAIQTDISMHNWSNPVQTLTEVSQYYNELTNVMVSYYIAGSPESKLNGAKLSYTWDYGSGSDIGEDPMHSGYYTFELNTSSAPSTAKYGIDISLSLENYTTKNFVAYIDILPRSTVLNGTTTLKHITENVWIHDAYNFIFEYNDTTGTENLRVGDLETAFYYWYKIDVNGTPIGSPSPKINLNLTADNLYVLDFDTETRDIGDYAIFITLQKNNYEARNAFINLAINKRTISYTLTATNLEGSQINVVKGRDIIITLNLKDISKNLADLTNGTVILTIDDVPYTFVENESGIYELIFSTTDIDAFFISQIFSGKITISKSDYISIEIPIMIVVGMEEIFPGIPLFYFILIAGACAISIGGIVGYKAIQYSRIPEFTKKVNKMKKAIKSNKTISESLATETKLEYMVNQLSDKWDKLGLSLKDTLEIKGKKLEEIKQEPIETQKEPPEIEKEYPEVEEEPPKPEVEYPEVEEEPPKPEVEYPEVEEEPPKPEVEYPEVEKEPPEPDREYDENQEGGSEE